MVIGIATAVLAGLSLVGYVIFLGGFAAQEKAAVEAHESLSILYTSFLAVHIGVLVGTPIMVALLVLDGMLIIFLKKRFIAFAATAFPLYLTAIPVIAGCGVFPYMYLTVSYALYTAGLPSGHELELLSLIPGYFDAMFGGLLIQLFFLTCAFIAGAVGKIIAMTTAMQGQNGYNSVNSNRNQYRDPSMEQLVVESPN